MEGGSERGWFSGRGSYPSHNVRRNPLDDTVRHSVLGFLQDETSHFRGFVLAETLVQDDDRRVI